MDTLLRNSDFITFHVGGQMVGRKEIAIMKNKAILINTARSGVVNEKDPDWSPFDSGKLAHARMFWKQTKKPTVPFSTIPGISLTPHIGASTNEAQETHRHWTQPKKKLIAALHQMATVCSSFQDFVRPTIKYILFASRVRRLWSSIRPLVNGNPLYVPAWRFWRLESKAGWFKGSL